MTKRDVMECLDIEPGTKRGLGAPAKISPTYMPELVAARLPGPDDIALHFADAAAFGFSDGLGDVADGALAIPTDMMDTRVDYQPHGAEKHRLEITDLAERIIVIGTHLISQLLSIKAPSFTEARHLEKLQYRGAVRALQLLTCV